MTTVAALAAVLIAPASAVAAEAARPTPKGPTALTRNPIYTTGEFDFAECKEAERRPDDLDSYRLYLDNVLDCLNLSWAEEFKQAGLKFRKPPVKYITKIVQTGCGRFPKTTIGVYCPKNRTLWIMITKSHLADPSELTLFGVIAHEYGHYVQDRVGIFSEYYRQLERAYKWNKKGYAKTYFALTRRLELQAECLSGAFIGSVWHSLERAQFDYEDYADGFAGDPEHGTAKSIRYWAMRGWKGNGPTACNTWAAPASKVA